MADLHDLDKQAEEIERCFHVEARKILAKLLEAIAESDLPSPDKVNENEFLVYLRDLIDDGENSFIDDEDEEEEEEDGDYEPAGDDDEEEESLEDDSQAEEEEEEEDKRVKMERIPLDTVEMTTDVRVHMYLNGRIAAMCKPKEVQRKARDVYGWRLDGHTMAAQMTGSGQLKLFPKTMIDPRAVKHCAESYIDFSRVFRTYNRD